MFVLRKITGDGVQMNFSLGESYTLILKENNPEDFKRASLAVWTEENPENTYGFVSKPDGQFIALFKKQFNYIMTSDGNTFANVSLK
jgi:hypothetical protein